MSRTIQYWGNLIGSSLELVISDVLRQEKVFHLIITPDTRTAIALDEAIRFFAPEIVKDILHFPDWETLPYDAFSPHEDIISERLKTLSHLTHQPSKKCLIVPVTTLMQRVCPKSFVASNSLNIRVGDQLDLPVLRRELESLGYQCVNEVITHGEFAVRGAILDIFPSGCEYPFRIDLFDNDVDSIRTFSPDTQLSLDQIDAIHCLPAKEFPLNDEGISIFKQAWRQQFDGNPLNCPLYEDITQGYAANGIEYYLPLFFESLETLFDYIPEESNIILMEEAISQSEHAWKEVVTRYDQCAHDTTHPIVPPELLWLRPNELFENVNRFSQIRCYQQTAEKKDHIRNFQTQALPSVTIEHRSNTPLIALEKFIKNFHGRVLLCAESPGRREVILELLKKHSLIPHQIDSWDGFIHSNDKFCLTVTPLEKSVIFGETPWAIISEADVFGQRVSQRRKQKTASLPADQLIKSIAELQLHDPIVHIEHGVGRYLGLQCLTLGAQTGEFITIEYDRGDKLYVPVTSLHLISRYSGGEIQNAPIHKLGTDRWDKAKKKALKRAYDVAAELLNIYAAREAKKGLSFKATDSDYSLFANAFPFEETPDQARAIEDVIRDLSHDKPMDRLVCGDVGFGKTEVAMRAAFLAVQNNKQVAILVPTTLLAEQHGQNFIDRFADWPVCVEVLSRFKTPTEQKEIINKLANGKVDIVIGTHKLLQKEVKYQQLGLIIIDEEHRFGVRQKEYLKSLRTEVHVLTLTATPIPRTLNMAMSHIRDLSIIATPPEKRLAIKTFLHERRKHIIREAISRELHRGGQVYFLHNNVKTIPIVLEELKTLLPEANIRVAHGQMRERELEHVMTEFYHRRFNVLLCTTIIETGIDIPTANTIIIDRADKLGLAQLHQLRGRVGRSHHQAYAYLLTPEKDAMTSDAKKRLDAIASLGDLGAGFMLASHDLEIRGAGELLGEDQSGQMAEIGFSLYLELLEKAVEDIKAGKTPEVNMTFDYGPEIDCQVATLIPEDYLPDVHTRLQLYKRIANADSEEGLQALRVEMIDRFGLLPEPTKALFNITDLKLQAKTLGIKKIVASASQCKIDFNKNTSIDPGKLIQLIQKRPNTYKLIGSTQLKVQLPSHTQEERIAKVEEVLCILV
ncbi:MAG: transcription-repair coupling factor [Gammaproteobacteria bacterium]